MGIGSLDSKLHQREEDTAEFMVEPGGHSQRSVRGERSRLSMHDRQGSSRCSSTRGNGRDTGRAADHGRSSHETRHTSWTETIGGDQRRPRTGDGGDGELDLGRFSREDADVSLSRRLVRLCRQPCRLSPPGRALAWPFPPPSECSIPDSQCKATRDLYGKMPLQPVLGQEDAVRWKRDLGFQTLRRTARRSFFPAKSI